MSLEEKTRKIRFDPNRESDYSKRKNELGWSSLGFLGSIVVAHDGYGPVWYRDGRYIDSISAVTKEQVSKEGKQNS